MDFFLEFYTHYYPLVWYFILINIVTFIVYGLDKLFAASQSRRIRERTLLVLALLGGSLGALVAIQLFRHKTRKNSFLIWFILIFLLHLIAIFYLTGNLWMKVG